MSDFYGISISEIDMNACDCVDIQLTLNDYDWACYTLKMQFKLTDKTVLISEEEFDGFKTSRYVLKRINGDDVEEVEFSGKSDYAERHIKKNMERHLQVLDEDEWYINDIESLIEQYNEVCHLLQIVKEQAPKERTYKRGEKHD